MSQVDMPHVHIDERDFVDRCVYHFQDKFGKGEYFTIMSYQVGWIEGELIRMGLDEDTSVYLAQFVCLRLQGYGWSGNKILPKLGIQLT
jgi:hypothetical protein